jgi:hypothetical protein
MQVPGMLATAVQRGSVTAAATMDRHTSSTESNRADSTGICCFKSDAENIRSATNKIEEGCNNNENAPASFRGKHPIAIPMQACARTQVVPGRLNCNPCAQQIRHERQELEVRLQAAAEGLCVGRSCESSTVTSNTQTNTHTNKQANRQTNTHAD